MSERDTEQLTLVEAILLATNPKIGSDLAKRAETGGHTATEDVIPVRLPVKARSHHHSPCPACRKWARRQRALRTARRILVGMALAGAVVGLLWMAERVVW